MIGYLCKVAAQFHLDFRGVVHITTEKSIECTQGDWVRLENQRQAYLVHPFQTPVK